MHNAAHITLILYIPTSAWLMDYSHKACELRSLLIYFMADIKISCIENYQRSVMEMLNDSFPGQSVFYM